MSSTKIFTLNYRGSDEELRSQEAAINAGVRGLKVVDLDVVDELVTVVCDRVATSKNTEIRIYKVMERIAELQAGGSRDPITDAQNEIDNLIRGKTVKKIRGEEGVLLLVYE